MDVLYGGVIAATNRTAPPESAHRFRWLLFFMKRQLLFVLCLLALAQDAQAQNQTVRVFFVLSEDAMETKTAVIAGLATSAHRLTEVALDEITSLHRGTSPASRSLRIAQVYFVSLPIASLSHTLIHEIGHAEHAERLGGEPSFRITQWPWPVPLTFATSQAGVQQPGLAIVSGGSEAAFGHERYQADAIYADERTHYFNWIAYIYAKLDTLSYIQRSLDADGFRDGDPQDFVLIFEHLRAAATGDDEHRALAIARQGASLRAQSWRSLLDLTLVSAVSRTLQYVWTGERFTEPFQITVGQIRVVPSWHFVLTPHGYENRAAIRMKFARQQLLTYYRHITSPIRDNLVGIGGSWRKYAGAGLRVTLDVDGWRTELHDNGYRVSVGAQRAMNKLSGVELGGFLGYKSAGYLEGYPTGSTVLFGLTSAIRF